MGVSQARWTVSVLLHDVHGAIVGFMLDAAIYAGVESVIIAAVAALKRERLRPHSMQTRLHFEAFSLLPQAPRVDP